MAVGTAESPGTGLTTSAGGKPQAGSSSSCSSLAVWARCGHRRCRAEVLKEPPLAPPWEPAWCKAGISPGHAVLGARAVAVPLLSCCSWAAWGVLGCFRVQSLLSVMLPLENPLLQRSSASSALHAPLSHTAPLSHGLGVFPFPFPFLHLPSPEHVVLNSQGDIPGKLCWC